MNSEEMPVTQNPIEKTDIDDNFEMTLPQKETEN